MLVKVNPTGTHERDGLLKIRLDLYPGIGDKTYQIHYVDKPVRPYTEAELEDESLRVLVPTKKELNPCLCHFVTVDKDITQAELRVLIRKTFDRKTLHSLDEALSGDDRKKVSLIMRNKKGDGLPVNKGTYRVGSRERKGLDVRLSETEVSV